MITKAGNLTVVGTGILSVAHCTLEAKAAIEAADVVFTQVPEPLGLYWLRQLNPELVPLNDLYDSEPDRAHAYVAMSERILAAVREGKAVCAAFYGHPGVFVDPSHAAIAQARAEGYEARMLPGISAEDCLFADLGFDPAERGCQAFEATSFLFFQRVWDPTAALVIWQIGVAGDHTLTQRAPVPGALAALRDKLLVHYPPEHRVAIYEAAMHSLAAPHIAWLPLADLAEAPTCPFSTMYVPGYGEYALDEAVLARLGLTAAQALTGSD